MPGDTYDYISKLKDNENIGDKNVIVCTTSTRGIDMSHATQSNPVSLSESSRLLVDAESPSPPSPVCPFLVYSSPPLSSYGGLESAGRMVASSPFCLRGSLTNSYNL